MTSTEAKDWKGEYAKLSARFNALSSNFKKAKEALQKRRDERDRWINHAAWLEKKIKTAEDEHNIQILDPGTRQTEASNHLETEATRPVRDASFVSDGGIEHAETSTTRVALPVTTTAPRSDEHAALGADPDATQGDSEDKPEEELPPLPQPHGPEEVYIKEEPSSDKPVFVSERCLKKRKRDDDMFQTPAARSIKVEPQASSSSPELSLHHCDFNPHESPDLGDVAQTMHTPRKRRELEAAQRFNHQAADPSPTSTAGIRHGEREAHVARPSTFSSALTPVNVNRRLLAETTSAPPDKPLSKGLSHGIAVLAEDGGIYKKVAHITPVNQKDISPAIKGRLDTLLNSPSPAEDPSNQILRTMRRSREAPVTPREELPIPKPRELPFEKSVRQSIKDSNAHTSRSPRTPLSDTTNTFQKRKPPPQSTKSHRSLLRNKPLSELRLEDFKINPQANEGHDFAYSEVVRDKDERACLSGCVDMHCCGKVFRGLALSQRPNPPLTPAQRQEEQKLLEDYLGDYAYRLATMTREERSELWIEAKMRELADKHGTHRHRFSRMRSPPGFWNADFPSTQELEADRAEVVKRERQTLQERHREAMRPEGRWMFRDE